MRDMNLSYKLWASLESKTNLWLALILLISLGLRLILPAGVTGSEGRSRWYRIAERVAEGRGFTLCWPEYFPFCSDDNEQTATAEPVPILVYAGFITWLGNENGQEGISGQAIIIFQTILGLATILLLYKTVMYLFDHRPTALLAAFLWGTYLPLITVERDLLSEAILMIFLMAGILSLLHGLHQGRAFTWVLAGLFLGLAALSRSIVLYFIPLLIPFILLLSPLPIRRRLINAALLLGVVSLVLTPWVIRNARTFGGFIPGNTMTGYNLYRHNHIVAGDNYLRYVFIKEVEQALKARIEQGIREQRTDVRGDENEYEMDRLYRREALQIIQAHPDRYLLLSLYRLIPLLTDFGVRIPLTPIWQWVGAETIVMFVLALIAVIRRRGAPYTMLPILALVMLVIAGYMLINARIRFTLPVMPYVMALASDQCMYWGARIYEARLIIVEQ